MPYCVKCGVELSNEESNCPLCSTIVYNPENTPKYEVKIKNLKKERATVRYVRNKFINITGFCIFSVMLILAIINLSVSGKFDWSVIPLCTLSLLWFLMVFPVKYSKRLHPVIIIEVCILASSAFLIILDALTIFDGWSLIVLYSCAFACFAVALPILNKVLKVKDVISFVALGASLYIILLDIHLGFTGWSFYVAGGIVLAWSFILFPLYIKRKYSIIGAMFFDSLLVLAYLFFALSAVGHLSKFISFALPLVNTVALPVMLTYLISKYCRFSVYGVLSLCFFFTSLAALSIDRIMNLNIYHHDLIFHQWSIITSACCLVIALFLYIIERNAKLKDYLDKKLNI